MPPDAKAAVIGAGPAGLMAAEVLSAAGVPVTVYDRMPSAGRKFLMAGRGGLNLTHSEDLPAFLDRYGAAAESLRAAIEALPPEVLRAWCDGLGQETFVGSSGRVFPKSLKASPLLRAWLRRLAASGVEFVFRHRWIGWDTSGHLQFDTPAGRVSVQADATVLALGGASWPRLGSDGGWAGALAHAGVAIAPLRPANCGFIANWSDVFRDRFEGQPLKRIELAFRGRRARGEAVITRDGLEGGAVYALSAALRETIAASGEAVLHIALRPDLSAAELQQRLAAPRGKQSLSTFLRKTVNLSPPAIGLLNEAAASASLRLVSMDAAALAALINAVPVRLVGTAPLERAISTAGGVSFAALDEHFMLRGRPGTFAAGEMLDWEAPTGGYLLQASFATGAAAARGALAWLSGQGVTAL
ncbi:MAG: TIGR03862 family flavoprotein [Xanthobacteraceae bacterium]|nr:TIGR03862 family flavoprotein [Xanthobacteraceae bacterium]